MMFKKDYKLDTVMEEENCKRYKETLDKCDDDIKRFANVLGDYSFHYLFNEVKMVSSSMGCNYYKKMWNKALENNNIDTERANYRKKVYYLLKTSKYDDGYVEDNIEKYTDDLISFCTNSMRIFNFYSLYNNEQEKVDSFYDVVKNPPLENSAKDWIKKKTKRLKDMGLIN